MFEPVKVAFGQYMVEFFNQLVPTTMPMEAYVQKPVAEAVLMAPSRMIDAAQEMFEKYLRLAKNDPTRPHFLPVMIWAVGRDYTPTGRDYTRQIADMEYFSFPEDEKERVFGVRTVSADLRAQVAIFTSDEPTAKSIASQLLLFTDETFNRRFWASYEFAGFKSKWPVQLESPDSPAMNVQTEEKNLNILAVDFTFKTTAPLFYAPKVGEPNDGKGVPGDKIDPAGYLKVATINLVGRLAKQSNEPPSKPMFEKSVNYE